MSFKIEQDAQPFADKFYASQGWEYHRVGAHDFDLFVSGERVEEKFRPGIYQDIGIEILQCMKDIANLIPKALGWFYTEKFVYLHYFMGCGENGIAVLYRIRWSDFVPWLWSWLNVGRTMKISVSPKGYGVSLQLLIPISEIPSAIYARYELTKGAANSEQQRLF